MQKIYLILVVTVLAQSCSFYKRDVLFKAPKEKEEEFAKNALGTKTGKNYLTNKNDFIEFVVFTNKGEVLIDPTSEFAKQVNAGSSGSGGAKIRYLIEGDGYARLPIIGRVKLDSLTIRQCDSLLGSMYSKYYQDAFVMTKISNRRVFIMGKGMAGSVGGGGGGAGAGGATVLELENENTTLLEVLAKVGGAGANSFANRIKVIRGDLSNPLIMTFDLTHWDTFQKTDLVILPNDIIYIEPGRRTLFSLIRDISVLSGLVSTALTLYFLTRL